MNLKEKFYKDNPKIVPNMQVLENVIDIIKVSVQNDKKIIVCGNGGNSADSDHIVGELVKGFRKPRKLSCEQVEKFTSTNSDYLTKKLQNGIKAISLTANGALNFAIGNDTGFDMIFAQQVYVYGEEGDVLITMSSSGKSQNVILATECANSLNMITISITGNKENELAKNSKYNINVGESETYLVQELTLPIYHYICARLEEELF